jgi:hypothetical protein
MTNDENLIQLDISGDKKTSILFATASLRRIMT